MLLKLFCPRVALMVVVEMLVLLAVLVTAVLSIIIVYADMREDIGTLLSVVAEVRGSQVEHLFEDLERDVRILAADDTVLKGMRGFEGGVQDMVRAQLDNPKFDEEAVAYGQQLAGLNDEADNVYSHNYDPEWRKLDAVGRVLQGRYIFANPFAVNRKYELTTAGAGDTYDTTHEAVHATLRGLMEDLGLYDIMLIDTQGRVVYSVYKEMDLGSNIQTGAYAHSGMAQVAAQALRGEAGVVHFSDMGRYVTSVVDVALFAGAPIMDGKTVVGALVAQVPPDRFNKIAQGRDLMAKSGDVFLIGQDRRLRTQQHGVGARKPMDLTTSQVATAVEAGHKGWLEAEGREGQVIYAYVKWLWLPDNLRWAILARVDRSEVATSAGTLMAKIAVLALGMLVALLAVGYTLAQWLGERLDMQLNPEPAPPPAPAVVDDEALDLSAAQRLHAELVERNKSVEARLKQLMEENGRKNS